MAAGRSRQRRRRSLAAISFLLGGPLPRPSAVAFMPPSASSSRSRREFRVGGGNAAGKRRGAASVAIAAAPDDDDDAPSEFRRELSFGPRARPDLDDADSVRRRRLVLSLLASASLAPFAAVAQDDDYYYATPTAPPGDPAAVLKTTASSPSNGGPVKIIKPPLDKRVYDTFVLPNGLKVLLVSDPASTTSAVAMNVHVGACSDPVEIPGLAHFCEHMLFLGTELYPEEDSFSKFLSSNGESVDDGR